MTVVSPDAPDGPELLLEPMTDPDLAETARAFQAALHANGVPAGSFGIDDLDAEMARIRALGHDFLTGPLSAGPVRWATLDDGCGNVVRIMQYAG